MREPGGFDHPIADQRILVTGGAGFIGSHIVDALVESNTVRVLDDLSSGLEANVPDTAELIVGDVGDPETVERAMEGIDLVFHEAAEVSVARSIETPIETKRTNADATLHILEAAQDQDTRLVLASSAAVYGHPERVPVSEGHQKAPTSPYGLSKLIADQYCQLYTELYQVPTVALRYFNVYGPRQPGGDYSGVISTFTEQAKRGEPITVDGDGEQTRDFIHVADVVRANLRAATTSAVGRAFNVGTGESITIEALAEEVRAVADSSSRIVHQEPRPGDIRHSRADTRAAEEILGFEASISLQDGLRSVPSLNPV